MNSSKFIFICRDNIQCISKISGKDNSETSARKYYFVLNIKNDISGYFYKYFKVWRIFGEFENGEFKKSPSAGLSRRFWSGILWKLNIVEFGN